MQVISVILWVYLILLLQYLKVEARNYRPNALENIDLEARKSKNIMNGLTFRVPAFDVSLNV